MRPLHENFANVEIPFGVTWKIPREKFVSLGTGILSTSEFISPALSDIKYKFVVQYNTQNQCEFYIYISNFYNQDIQIDYKISGENSEDFYANTFIFQKWMYRFCCYTADDILDDENMFINEILTIKFKGIFKLLQNDPIFFNKNTAINLWNDEEKDFTIVTEDGQELQVHKNILRASSPVFAGMLKSGMKEAVENKVVIKGFNLEVIEIAMKFCYGIVIRPCSLSLEIAMSVLQFTEIYDIENLKDQMEKFLILQINITNIFQLRECSVNAYLPNLERKCFEFLNNCAENGLTVGENEITYDEAQFYHICETE